jgi:STE24 endopeptidase
MTVALMVLIAVVLLGAGVVAGRLVRARAARIAHSEADRPERVHRLQRLSLIVLGGYVLAFGVLGALFGALAGFARRHHHSPAGAAIVGGAGLIAVAFALFAGSRAIRRAIAEVRGTKLTTRGRRRQIAAGLAIGGFWAVAVVIGDRFVPRHGAGHLIGLVAVYVVGIFLLTSVVAPLIVVRVSSKPLTGETAQRLRRLAAGAGVRVRAFRVLSTRGQKIANAAQMGTIPGFRYVLVTDYLLDHLPAPEVDAVVAHELGHARRHHILIKVSAVVAVWVVLEGAVVAIRAAAGHTLAALLVLPVFVAIPVGVLLTQGLLGIRFEEAADDEAAQLVGADRLSAALEHIGELNDTKRNTGRGWALITQHPGLEARLRRLRAPAHRSPAHA